MHKPLHTFVRLTLAAALCLGSTHSFAQGNGSPAKKQVPAAALEHIKKNKQKLELTDEDIADIALSSESESKKSGVKHVYMKQLYQGIEIHGAITNISLDKDSKVVTMGNRFHKEIGKKVKGNQAGLDAEAAVAAAARHLNTSIKEALTVKERGGGKNKEVLFSTGGISLEPIPARLVYQPMEDGSLVLAWEVSIYELDAQNWWNLRIDANTGKVLDKDNLVTQCNFDNAGAESAASHVNHSHSAMSPYVANMETKTVAVEAVPYTKEAMVATGSLSSNYYSVFNMPTESPSHGNRVQVSNTPANPFASPNGWHTAGEAKYTITRGNNVYAYEDPDNTGYAYSPKETYGYSPDGGSSLQFDFPVDFTQEPVTYRDAAITNLFYWNNIIHDVWYQYGFDEESGSFQVSNFGKGGLGGDPVMAEAQDSRNISVTRNNANFGTPPDGTSPRMQMYLWSGKPDPSGFTVNSPASIAGGFVAAGASFGPKLSATPLPGKLVLAIDGVSPEGCNTLTNADAIRGNIALVYRGTCAFTQKVLNAQDAGAIAVVVINSQPGDPTSMGGNPARPVNIPSVMISKEVGASVREALDAGQEVHVNLKNEVGPEVDGDFDNGIIVHEYGHGISNRLTGGPNVVTCLSSSVGGVSTEQMGEGWSDWFGLMMTMKTGDISKMRRGIGTYVSHQPTDGNGIRPTPYSTDFGVNNYTYAATNNPALSAPHGVGFVWATMLWDMTWDLIDKYGYDEDLYNGKGGNNIAMQLVIDGLKFQPCRPGFVDGRDAILAADRENYGGANQELIWRAFAKRGLGFSASQGSNLSRFDQVEAFDVPPMYACVAPTIAVQKTSDVYTGGDANTIFLGYGAQSVTLTASGDRTFTYTWAPVKGLSSTGASAVFKPTSAGTYTLSVTAVNQDNCTRSAAVTIKVIDVRCGAKKDKVMVCVDGEDQCVAPKSVDWLLTKAGGKLGSCSLNATATAAAVAADGQGSLPEELVSSYPNPFSESTSIRFTAKESAYTSLKVYDITGREVATLFDGNAESGVTYTQSFKAANKQAGVYIYRLVNGSTSKSGTMLLIK